MKVMFLAVQTLSTVKHILEFCKLIQIPGFNIYIIMEASFLNIKYERPHSRPFKSPNARAQDKVFSIYH